MVTADVQIAETNAGPVETPNVANINHGDTDTVNLVPANFTVVAGENSYAKYNRIRLNLINDSNKIDNFKHWMTPSTPETGITYKTNCQEDPSLQNDSFVNPVKTTSTVADQSMPTTPPTATNVGVSGGTGGLSSDATHSDYIVSQVQTTVSADPGDLIQKTLHFQYDEQ
jgi:hypothetical protein